MEETPNAHTFGGARAGVRFGDWGGGGRLDPRGRVMQLTIEIDEKDVREAIASVPEFWWNRSDGSPVVKIAKAVKQAYERAKQVKS
jgi:hypothetical protein